MTDNGKMCVFISYAIEDRALAALIKDVLKANRVEVLDPMTDLLPGDSFNIAMTGVCRLVLASGVRVMSCDRTPAASVRFVGNAA